MNDRAENPYARLASLLQKRRAGGLSFYEVRELVALHERVSADLSLAQERGLSEADILRPLVMESFNAIYGARLKPRRVGVKAFFNLLANAPKAVHRFRGYILLVALTTLISAFLGSYGAFVSESPFPVYVLGEEIIDKFQQALESDGDWALAASIPGEIRPAISAFIIQNNIRVTIFAFLIGIFLGYFTLGLIFVNGYMLGYIGSLYFAFALKTGNSEFAYYFLAGVLPHGVLEIPAIIFGASAGVAIGLSWLFPGRIGRLENLQKRAREVLPLIALAILLLVIAGLIEGFITPLGAVVVSERALSSFSDRLPIYLLKIVFSVLLFSLLVLWLGSGKASASAPQNSPR